MGSRGRKSAAELAVNPGEDKGNVVALRTSERIPDGLEAAGKKLWEAVTAEFAIEGAIAREILRQACAAADTAEATKAVQDYGRETQARALVARLLQRLIGGK